MSPAEDLILRNQIAIMEVLTTLSAFQGGMAREELKLKRRIELTEKQLKQHEYVAECHHSDLQDK